METNPQILRRVIKALPFVFAVLFCSSVLSVTIYVLWTVIQYPYQMDGREDAAVVHTHMLLQGMNPYLLKYQPSLTYCYGFLYSFFALPIAYFFHSTLFVHRLVSAVFIFGSSCAVYWVYRYFRWPVFVSILAAFCMGIPLIKWSGCFAKPDSLGLFLLLFAICLKLYLPFPKNIGWSLAVCFFAWMAKPYFILGIVPLFLHSFFYESKSTTIKAFLLFSCVVSVALFLLALLFPTYFNNTFFMFLMDASVYWPHLKKQSGMLLRNQAPLFFLLGVFLFRYVSSKPGKRKTVSSQGALPLLFLAVGALAYIRMGLHKGSTDYHVHLVIPFLLLSLVNLFDSENNLTVKYVTVLFMLQVALTLPKIPPTVNEEVLSQMQKVEQLISDTQGKVLIPASLAFFAVKYNQEIFYTGHSEFFPVGNNPFNWLAKDVQLRQTQFEAEMNEKIATNYFDLIVGVPLNESILDKYYKKVTWNSDKNSSVYWLPKGTVLHRR